MKNLRYLALLSALIPVALVGGCGGGSGTAPIVPATTTIPGTDLGNYAFRLDTGQIGLFSLTRKGIGLTGTLRILDAVTSQPKVPVGDYSLEGTFADPNSFLLTSSANEFRLSGTLPTASAPGTYTLGMGVGALTGPLFYDGLPAVAAVMPYSARGDLKFSEVKALGPIDDSPNSRIDFAPVTPTGSGAFAPTSADFNLGYPTGGTFYYPIKSSINSQGLTATGTRINFSNHREDFLIRFALDTRNSTRPFFVGQSFDLSNPQPGIPPVTNSVSANFASERIAYQSVSGSVTIKSLGAESLALELRDVVLVTNDSTQNPGDTRPLPNDNKPTGSVTINGTFEANGLGTLVRNNQ